MTAEAREPRRRSAPRGFAFLASAIGLAISLSGVIAARSAGGAAHDFGEIDAT